MKSALGKERPFKKNLKSPFDKEKFKKKIFKFLFNKLAQGMEIPTILTKLQVALPDEESRMIIKKLREDINNGLSLTASFDKTRLFTNFEIAMITVGEKARILDLVLEYLLEQYKRKSMPTDLERFVWIMGRTLASGIEIKEAIKLSAKCVNNKRLVNYLLGLSRKAEKETCIFKNLDRELFPRWTRILLSLGEKGGCLEECLLQIAKIEKQISEGRIKSPDDRYLYLLALKILKNCGFPRSEALKLMATSGVGS